MQMVSVSSVRRRVAFTLFEVVLVLAVLVVLAVVAYPSIDAMYGDYRLDAAADKIRAAWVEAQSRAINEGRAYRFAIQASEGIYRVAPESPDYWNGSELPGLTAESGSVPLVIDGQLERGAKFGTVLGAEPGTDRAVNLAGAEAGSAGTGWIPLVTFLPDGTTAEDVELRIQGTGLRPIQLRIRSLTGIISRRSLPIEAATR